jgi:hypothetical protein
MIELDVQQSDIDDYWYLAEKCPMKTDEQKELEEKERIAKLFLTGADVERGIYQAKGMDFDDILAFVMATPPAGLDVKALRIELKANHFYRGNPYVNAVGSLLGFTSEQLDKFFEFNDFNYLLPKEEPTEEEETVEDETDETESNTTYEPTDISV